MKDINRRTRKDSDSSSETPDFFFAYADADSLASEIAEWYTYSEEAEFLWNADAFKKIFFQQKYANKNWNDLTRGEKKTHIIRLLDQTENSDKKTRDDVCRSILYLAQGVFKECDNMNDYYTNMIENVILLYECDAFNIFVDILLFEINNISESFSFDQKYAPCITDNADLRVILSVLYTIIEVIRSFEIEANSNRYSNYKDYEEKISKIKSQLKNDLNKPLQKTNELFSVYLFQLVNKFCNQNLIVLPIKKILLLLWKVLLFSLGGLDEAFRLKNELRQKFNLPLITENPSVILKNMTPATPPPNPIDIVNELNFANPNSSYKRKKNGLTKQTKGIDNDDLSLTNGINSNGKLTQFGISSSNNISSESSNFENNLNNHNIRVRTNIVRISDRLIAVERNEEESSSLITNEIMSNDIIETNLANENMSNNVSENENIASVEPIMIADDEGISEDDTSELANELVRIADEESSDTLVDSNSYSNDPSSSLLSISSNSTETLIEGEKEEPSTPYPRSNSPTSENSNDTSMDLSLDSSLSSSVVSKSPPSESSMENEQEKLMKAANDATYLKLKIYNQLKTLPWKPKVRLAELESFLDQERKKFLGYGDLTNDLDTLIGLPYPIHESVKILKQHLYVSLADEQIKLEEKLYKYPMLINNNFKTGKNLNDLLSCIQKPNENMNENIKEDEETEQPAEILFSSLLTNLPQYLICLLKLLLTSVPQTKPKGESLQIMSDLFPEDLNGSRFLTIKLGIDSNRHKEILIKAISAILLLMLKHFKVNHVYQFEFMCQHLLFANCVPLILKFFNLNISSFIQSKNNYSQLDFPNCVIGEQLELDANELENGDSAIYRWRNVFSCINLLRILNKIVKYKRSRVMMLVIFKSAQIFKKVLRIKQAMLQYYALKLIKMQTRNMGRNWRKTNMSTMSAIYQKVRHRLNDDWAFGNELEAQAWDFQSEESVLRSKIDRYNQRKYRASEDPVVNEFKPSDNTMYSVMNKTDVEIPENFGETYEKWLDEEVFSNKINWDLLLESNGGGSDCDNNHKPKVSILF